jgi:cytochrome P450
MFSEPTPFYSELRKERPVLNLPNLTIATTIADCTMILRRHEAFGVDLYKPKQGTYFMAQDDTAAHWREKSIMKAVLDRENLPVIREWVGAEVKKRVAASSGKTEVVSQVTRAVPIALVQEWFGFTGAEPEDLLRWSYWNQQDAFWNQPFDNVLGRDQEAIIKSREDANVELTIYLAKLVAKRGLLNWLWKQNDTVSRLLSLSQSGALKFPVTNVVLNVGGLLIGAVETTSHAAVNALDHLLGRDDIRTKARVAAASTDVGEFDGYVFEALRFKPAFPYFFRTCHRETVLSAGTAHQTKVSPGMTVLAVTHSAMFDEVAFPDPYTFDATRDLSDAFTFGQGLHQCLGIGIARVMVPEIVRQLLLLPNLRSVSSPDYRGGTVPESWSLQYDA